MDNADVTFFVSLLVNVAVPLTSVKSALTHQQSGSFLNPLTSAPKATSKSSKLSEPAAGVYVVWKTTPTAAELILPAKSESSGTA